MRNSNNLSPTCPIMCLIFLCNPLLSISVDQLGPGKSITGNQTLVSNGGTYRMGFFFTPPERSSSLLYLGIWYNNISPTTVVWVANIASPINTTDGVVLTLTRDGNLMMVKDESTLLWSTGTANLSSPVARLMDSGNLVVSDGNSTNYSWQSFDHPTDTMLPDMKIGVDLRTGRSIQLTSWTTEDDPAPGEYSMGIDVSGVPELILYRNSNPLWRLGPWTGEYWSGFPQGMTSYGNRLNFTYSSTKDEVSYVFRTITNNTLTNMVVNHTGGKISWRLAFSATCFDYFPDPVVICSYYRKCGAYSICSGNETTYECRCLSGFTNDEDRNSTGGKGDDCRRIHPLDCQGETDRFEPIRASKLPETSKALVVEEIVRLEDCKASCLANCSCTAYASSNSKEESGCLMWFGDLQDISSQSEHSQDWYLRLASTGSEPAKTSSRKESKGVIVPVVVCGIVGLLLFGCVIAFLSLRDRKRTTGVYGGEGYQHDDDINLPIFDFSTISIATNNFSDENKLGEGGFGPVYKGRLTNEQLVAVKRLSTFSSQGLVEFKNEVRFITNLQHRNLVRLLGCCIHGGERMLIYEYMSNKSLDNLLFDKTTEKSVDWQTRFKIIVGIARGLLYLHRDSSLTIVHRDIKAANILLDTNMNPKVSDFGTARAFAGNNGDSSTSNTSRVIGTSEYMSPEYALDGVFSMKSDVFSFGVLLLEIVSGEKNKSIFNVATQHNLINHAWSLWEEGKALDLIDKSIALPVPEDEVCRCIKIGLLCVQEQPEDRPLMSMIVSMLGRVDVKSIKDPKKPKYIKMKVANQTGTSMSYSGNDVCCTLSEGR